MYFPVKPLKLQPSVVTGPGSGAELFIVEGDSAASAVGAIRNARDQAVLPMQGKPLNAWKAGTARVAGNALYAMLAATLQMPLADARAGGGSGQLPLHDAKSLPYERILLLFDADADGIHCGVLMLMFFYRWMRPLLESGRIALVRPPMFELRWQQDRVARPAPLQAYHEAQQRALQAELLARGARQVSAYRYRGLGNVDPAVLATACVDRGSRRVVPMGPDDARQAIEVFGASSVPGGRRVIRPIAIVALGDQAFFIEYSRTLELPVNAAAQDLAVRIRARKAGWLQDIVPTLGGVALYPDFDDPRLPSSPLQAVQSLVDDCLAEPEHAAGEAPRRLIEVPVCYEPAFALDLAALSEQLKIGAEELVRRHAQAEYRVLMMGFVPGHAYLGGLDASLMVPRRSSPRARVPAGSIAIANGQTVVYPFETPGGWNVVGRTPLQVFDPERDPPCLFAPRDAVRFVPISAARFAAIQAGGGVVAADAEANR